MNIELLSLLGASVIIMFASFSGVIFLQGRLKDWTHSNLKYLVAFASGVFLVVTANLVTESFEFSGNNILVISSIIFGFLFFFAVEKIYPESHCHHDDHKCLTQNNKKGARKILIGDSLHNITDGILLAPIFVTDVRLGFIAALGIFVHEFVQEISEFFVLKSAGYSTRGALFVNFLTSGTILIGSIGGFYISSFDHLVSPLIGLAAGAFIYTLVIDLIPESVKNSHKERKYFNYIAWTLLGVLLIFAMNYLSSSQLEKEGLDGHGHAEPEQIHSL